MAEAHIRLRMCVNRGRANALLQAATGELRRARKGDRPAIMDRLVRDTLATCVRVVPESPKVATDLAHKGAQAATFRPLYTRSK